MDPSPVHLKLSGTAVFFFFIPSRPSLPMLVTYYHMAPLRILDKRAKAKKGEKEPGGSFHGPAKEGPRDSQVEKQKKYPTTDEWK